jgi:diaminopimelate epimerase
MMRRRSILLLLFLIPAALGAQERGSVTGSLESNSIYYLDDAVVDRLGPILERHPFFPRRTNVEFCKVIDGKIHIRVYERGAAWTLACGTGACASTVAAALNGLVPFDEPVDVRLPGGWLRITADSGLRRVLMEGPAEMVFEGQCRRR